MHWGVASSPYHKMWSKHFAKQDTDNSTENIFIRQREFQNRSLYDGDTRNVYIFLSNLWDVKRYVNVFALCAVMRMMVHPMVVLGWCMCVCGMRVYTRDQDVKYPIICTCSENMHHYLDIYFCVSVP